MAVEVETPGTPAPQGDNTPAPSPSGGAPAAQPAVGTPAPSGTPAPRRFEYQEDRGNWVPPHRLRETSQRLEQLQRQYDLERSRVAALSGVTPPPAQDSPETAELKRQFEQLYPGFSKLIAKAEQLERLADLDPQEMTGAQEHYWQALGTQTLSRLDDEVQSIIGGDLTPFARRTMHSAFAAFVQGDRELAARYASQDPKLIKDFIKEYQTGVLDPYRRTITTQSAARGEARRVLPRGGNSTQIPGAGPAPIKPADTDEFHGAAFRALQQGRGQ